MANLTRTVTDPYSPLAVGTYAVGDWGGTVMVFPAGHNQVLVLDIDSDGNVLASIPWHLADTEQFADPLRVLRDDEQHPDDNPGLVRYH